MTDGKYTEIKLFECFTNTDDMFSNGFTQMNDFSLSALLNHENIVGVDCQPWNGVNKYFIWDEDFKRWLLAAERKY